MLANFFKIILRDLLKDKTYTIISVIGLSAAVSISVIMITLDITFFTYNKFHEKGNRIYQVFWRNDKQNSDGHYYTATSCILGETLANTFPEIKRSATVKEDAPLMFIAGDNPGINGEQSGIYSTESLFSVFSFPVIQKMSNEIFKDDNSIAVSEKAAKKYFGSVPNAIGKRIILRRAVERKEVYITAVFDNIPNNSSLRFDYVLPLNSLLKEQKGLGSLDNLSALTFFELNQKVNVRALNEKIKNYYHDHNLEQDYQLFLYKFEDVFLKPPGGHDISKSVLFNLLFAFIIILIAAINFINLAASRAAKKSKEITIRKIIGAKRSSLIIRFMTESFILSLIAIFLGLLLAELIVPYINESYSNFIVVSIPYGKASFIISLIGLWIIVGLLSGLYPSLFLSAFTPAGILKGITETTKRIYLRKSLITVQFVFSTLFIFIVIVLYKQMNYIKVVDLGLDLKQVIQFNLTDKLNKQYNSFINELKSNPDIIDITSADFDPTEVYNASGAYWEGQSEDLKILYPIITVNDNFIKTFNLQLMKGRDFIPGDSTDKSAYIVNERMAKIINKDNPVGMRLSLGADHGQVIGVIKDFRINTLQDKIQPLIIRKSPKYCAVCFIKVYSNDLPDVLKFIEENYRKYEDEYPFKYNFADDLFLKRHFAIIVLSRLFTLFSIIAIIISCMGLFGLTAYTIQQKTKEVGIRKVLGASVGSISLLLTKSVIRLVLIGAVIALPIGFYLAGLILQMFVYRINITAGIFLMSLAVVSILAAGTVIFQAIKAAIANPVDSLKYE